MWYRILSRPLAGGQGVTGADIPVMPAQCELCSKATTFGRNIRHRHAGRWERKAHKTNRQFRANLHTQVVWREGKKVKMTLCTRCLRSQVKLAG